MPHGTSKSKKKGKRRIAGRKLKGKEGAAVQFLTRNQALKRLQVTLPDFRRLCILKGIYPRDPKKKIHGRDKTYYYTKDILFLSHERILGSFRELKAFLKKFKKARAKDDLARVAKLDENRPTYNLDHIVRERYPSFVDGLRDIDDALCLVVLFATLPSDDHLLNTRVANCDRLAKELFAYIMRKGCLQKVFLSIKGIYYQAEVMGQTITWMAPYKFKQEVPSDVDMRVMLTFIEFYEVLLHFTNYKLYHDEGIAYPPDVQSVFSNSGKPLALVTNAEDEDMSGAEDEEGDAAAADAAAQDVPVDKKGLLADCFFFLSRETPVESLIFVIKSFGGRVVYEDDASGLTIKCEEITHHIADRPTQSHMFLDREYVQPQWVYDSVNNGVLLPTFEYAPGKELPNHLSPFVDDDAEGYIPKRKDYLRRIQGEADEAAGLVQPADDTDEEDEDEDENEDGDEEDEEEEEEEGVDGEGEEEEKQEEISGDEKEEAERPKKKGKMAKAEEDQKALASSLMSRKTRKMYTNIKRAENKKDAGVAELHRKRKEAAASKSSGTKRKKMD